MVKKFVILHYQPVEKYPPIMNLVRFLEKQIDTRSFVLTTGGLKNWFNSGEVNIYRIGKSNVSAVKRYLGYINFNFGAFLKLLQIQPEVILYYETYSVFPAFLYCLLYRRTRILIHYHEYVSSQELEKASLFLKKLHKLESKLYTKATWISHTNKDRLKFFLDENKMIPLYSGHILPNYPPLEWFERKTPIEVEYKYPVRIVYVGSVSLTDIYITEFAEWVQKQNGNCIWDIYTNSETCELIKFIRIKNYKFIKIMEGVQYYNLPGILKKYSIGVILYKGVIPNYIFNEPNKLFEYLAFGLDVWYAQEIIGCKIFETKLTFPKVIPLDFKKTLPELDELIDKQGLEFKKTIFSSEKEFQLLFDALF